MGKNVAHVAKTNNKASIQKHTANIAVGTTNRFSGIVQLSAEAASTLSNEAASALS